MPPYHTQQNVDLTPHSSRKVCNGIHLYVKLPVKIILQKYTISFDRLRIVFNFADEV